MGGVGKSGGNGNVKKTSGVSAGISLDKNRQVLNGGKSSPAHLRHTKDPSKGSGSRFDVLGEDNSTMMIEDEQILVTKSRGKSVLTEITNYPSKIGEKLNSVSSKGSKKTRKKGGLVSTAGRPLAKVVGSRDVSSTASTSIGSLPPRTDVDVVAIDSTSVLRCLHNEVSEVGTQQADPMETVEGMVQKEVVIPVSSLDKSFDMVASKLTEALAVISE
ncbi:hypothetical protein LWI29_011893 [Acer saccharum]|uniref:Uncharacterized protein n=1 Tax=Acer saccharum TaxID=4024 RepID=A0AA39SXB0_ACESA|nr:hypothetical protein LWI29_011893 [Acer saccharum]